jgi:hypothetical protein
MNPTEVPPRVPERRHLISTYRFGRRRSIIGDQRVACRFEYGDCLCFDWLLAAVTRRAEEFAVVPDPDRDPDRVWFPRAGRERMPGRVPMADLDFGVAVTRREAAGLLRSENAADGAEHGDRSFGEFGRRRSRCGIGHRLSLALRLREKLNVEGRSDKYVKRKDAGGDEDHTESGVSD